MAFVQELESEASAQLQAIRDYRTTPVSDAPTDMRNRAKTALGVIGAYVRLRATLANEKSNELIERRMGLTDPLPRPRLTDGEQTDAM